MLTDLSIRAWVEAETALRNAAGRLGPWVRPAMKGKVILPTTIALGVADIFVLGTNAYASVIAPKPSATLATSALMEAAQPNIEGVRSRPIPAEMSVPDFSA